MKINDRLKCCLAGGLLLASGAVPLRAQEPAAAASGFSQTMQDIRSRGKLVVGSGFKYRALSFKNPATGEYEGFEIDVIRALAKTMLGDETKIEWRQTRDADDLEPLLKGEVDMIIDPVSKGPRLEKEKSADFAAEFLHGGAALLVKKGSPIHCIDEILNPTRVLYVNGNERNLRIVRSWTPKATYIAFANAGEAFDALKAGKGDVFTDEVPVLYDLAAGNPAYTLTGRYTERPYFIIIRKGDPTFHKALTDFMHELITSGSHEKLYQKWLFPCSGNWVR